MNTNSVNRNSSFFQDIVFRTLVYYYGVLQLFHLIALIIAAQTYLANNYISLLAPPPEPGWTNQAVDFFLAMGAIDGLNAVLSIYFVKLFTQKSNKSHYLGLIVISLSFYSAILYILPVVTSGAFLLNLKFYIFLVILFFPVIILYYKFLAKLFKNH